MPAPRDVDDLLQRGLGAQTRAVLAAVSRRPDAAVLRDPGATQFAPLVTRPEKIICVGFNYRKHAEETGTPVPTEPPLFAKYRNALNHHRGTIALPAADRLLRHHDAPARGRAVHGHAAGRRSHRDIVRTATIPHAPSSFD